MPEDRAYPARERAGLLMKSLTETLGLVAPADEGEYTNLQSSLSAHLVRVGRSNLDDLCSWIFLECLEKHRHGIEVDWREVLRAADRIRHRINRQHSRERSLVDENIAADETAMTLSAAIDLRAMLKKLPQSELIIFNLFFLEGIKPSEIGKKLGMSPAQVYRRLCSIREMLGGRLR